jgi:hypothetical protein
VKTLGFLFCLLLVVGIAPVLACTPTVTPSATPVYTPTPFPGIGDYSLNAPVVFIGKVVREISLRQSWPRTYEIKVETYLKGSGFDTVFITGYGYGSDCLPMIFEGAERIFFVQEHSNSAGIPVYARMIDYSLDNKEAVTAITGQSLPAQALPLDIQFTRLAENGNLNWLYIPFSILAMFVGLGIFWFWRRGRRKPKPKRDI